ncbi:hypothetical protein FNV43_RR14261 [Rhamnella rubrinervis]|uniref:Uncharacterized protein n=1 Tax=Rhamnella rubrinervis TaxID=2594499 RepID=A0A8K0H2T2_9ROSA|nr:hypothetical protein FNV43_RR14261 [Rhamnella rubrinervis]
MSFGILRGFLKTSAYDSKIIVGGKLKAGWRCVKECFPELGFYAAFLTPFITLGNYYGRIKPTMKRLEREILEDQARADFTSDDVEEYNRRWKAYMHGWKENIELTRQINKLKKELFLREVWTGTLYVPYHVRQLVMEWMQEIEAKIKEMEKTLQSIKKDLAQLVEENNEIKQRLKDQRLEAMGDDLKLVVIKRLSSDSEFYSGLELDISSVSKKCLNDGPTPLLWYSNGLVGIDSLDFQASLSL